MPYCQFPANEARTILPIAAFLDQIHTTLSSHANLVLQAEPGAGKSTALPLSLLEANWLEGKKIVMLEPRRVAAKSIAHYLAKQLGENVGQRIGYQIKNERKLSKETVLEIVTEGILTRRLQNDPDIEDIGLIIFDEFHLRSLHADLSLLLSLEIQQTIREDLKLLVMSATIDAEMVSTYMSGAEVIECPGRGYPVSVSYCPPSKASLVDKVTSSLRTVLGSNSAGDVLVFLPGQGDINKCISESRKAFSGISDLLFLPLYGGLPIAQQEQALLPDPEGKKRVVFTTNIAETSLTIEGVTTVIDSGLEKVLTYDPTSCMTRLETSYISKASAEQRKGRAGRTQAGDCIRLWDEQKHRALKDYQEEEILTADLSGLILELSLWGSGDFEEINWLTRPPKPHYESAVASMVSLGLIDSNHKITPLGEKAATMGLSPRLATMLLLSDGDIERGIACELAALLSDRDIFYNNSSADIIDRLLAVQEYKDSREAALKTYPMKRSSVEQLLANSRSFGKRLNITKKSNKYSLDDLQNFVGKLLLYSYPDRLAKKRSNQAGRYQLANGRGVFLFDDDPLSSSDWLMVADCDAQKKEGRIYSASTISFGKIIDCLEDKLIEKEYYELDVAKQKIIGRKTREYGALQLASVPIVDIPEEKFQDCLLQIISDNGLELLNWTQACEEWLARVQWLSGYIDSFPKISKQSLMKEADCWLLPYISGVISISGLKKVNIFELLVGMLTWDEQQLLNQEAPTKYEAPSGRLISITYDKQQGPTVSVQLQEMFGQLDSPKIGGGKVAIRFELLSPARRPIQTTSDLGNFWKTSYFDVAKEMKGRYPKHRWPEQPLLEKPGKSIKDKA